MSKDSEEEKLIPFLDQPVKLYVTTSFFSFTIFGKLTRHIGRGGYDNWIGIEHNETLKFIEINWDRLMVSEIFNEGEVPSIFVKESL